jgi:hypothetical protein
LERTLRARSTDDTGGTGYLRTHPGKRRRPTSVGLALSALLLCFGASASASAAATPEVATEAATIETPSAALHGFVNPNGTEVTACYADYALGSYTYPAIACEPQVEHEPVKVSARIPSLQPGANYRYSFSVYYRNSSGETPQLERGKELSFTTPPAVTAYQPYAYVGLSGSQPYAYTNLQGYVQVNGAAVTDCHFEYGTSPAPPLGASVPCAQSLGATSGIASATVSPLQWATTYYARLVASDGAQGAGPVETFQTPNPITYTPYTPPTYTPTYPPYSYPEYSRLPGYRPYVPNAAALARCRRMSGARRAKCLAALRRRGGSSGPASDRGLSVYFCPYGRKSARPLTAQAASTSEAGWPPKECLKMDKGPAGQRHTIVGMRHVHNWLLGGYGSDTIVGGERGDVIWGDYHPSGAPAHQTAIIHAGNGRNVIYANDTLNYVWTGTNPKTIVHAHASGISGVIHCGSSSQVIFLSSVSQRHFKLDGCGRVSHYSVGY